MSEESVGKIGLDLVVNQKDFNKQMSGIQNTAKKIGKALASAFAVKKVVDFGKACISLGSDLAEVQNVVDVTFPNMSAQMDKFAQSAASSFGLSETMAKKFSGTFGAMAKAFGFSEQQAYDMSTALTGLAGDVASFYNITQDEAYTKLKSVFTGETESLKDLGVVMTQTALDAYALANGYGKTTSQMSEAEKVALRYSFVQNQLNAAAGDFTRTSGSWANQVRILNLQFDSLKATIGQGLITALTPVIKLVNVLIGRVMTLANTFKSLMEGLFGKQEAVTESSVSAEQAAAGMADSTAQTTDNLKKASRFLTGFDAINKVSGGDTESSGDVSGINFGSFSDSAKSAESDSSGFVDRMTEKIQSFAKLMEEKFSPSFKKVWDALSEPLDGFRTNAERAFADIQSLGQPLTDYFSGPFLDSICVGIESAGGITSGLYDSFNQVFADIWNIVLYPFAQRLIADWLPILTDFKANVWETLGSLCNDLKAIFDTLWAEGAQPALSQICEMFWDFMDLLKEFWDEWASPIFVHLQEAFTETKDTLLTAWEEVIRPIWEDFMSTVDMLWTEHLEPLVANFLDFVGEFVDGALMIYNQFVSPIVRWLVTILAPVFKSVFHSIFQVLSTIFEYVTDLVSGLITTFKGIVQFLTGVFTGDWRKAWTGIKNIFKGIFDSLVAVAKMPINLIIDLVNGLISGIVSGLNSVISALNTINISIPNWVPVFGGKSFGVSLGYLSAPQIPKLAEGGYIKKNTPRLAMIGDNRHQGEIVAPEDKLREMAIQAVREAGSTGISKEDLERIINNAVMRIVAALASLGFYIDGEQLAKAMQSAEQAIDTRFNPVTPT